MKIQPSTPVGAITSGRQRTRSPLQAAPSLLAALAGLAVVIVALAAVAAAVVLNTDEVASPGSADPHTIAELNRFEALATPQSTTSHQLADANRFRALRSAGGNG